MVYSAKSTKLALEWLDDFSIADHMRDLARESVVLISALGYESGMC